MHVDGRTVSASSTVTGDDGSPALVDRTLAAARLAPLDPGWPGLAPPAPLRPRWTAVDPATRDATPDDRAARVAAFVDAAGGLETAGYCRTDHWRGAFANSAGQSVAGETRRRRPRRDRPARRQRRCRPGRRRGRLTDIDGAVLGARAAAKADAGDRPGRDPARPLRGRARADRRRRHPRGVSALRGFNAKAVAERRSFVAPRRAQFDPSSRSSTTRRAGHGCRTTPRARRATRRARRRRARRSALDPRPAHGGRGRDRRRPATASGRRRSVPSPGTWRCWPSDPTATARRRGRRADRRLGGRRAGRRCRAGRPRHRLLVHPRARPARAGAHRADPQRRVADRARRGDRAAAQLPLHAVLRPGADAGRGARRRDAVAAALPGDTYSACMPWWTAPALHLASWNFTGGASG